LNLGEGHNGIVRYLRGEVIALEESLLHADTGKPISSRDQELSLGI
jgi:hypothetical protein